MSWEKILKISDEDAISDAKRFADESDLTTDSENEMERLAKKIDVWLRENELQHDVSIYFNGKGWRYGSNDTYTEHEDMLGSDYFKYANDDTISISFEGTLNGVMNGHYGEKGRELAEKIVEIGEGRLYAVRNLQNIDKVVLEDYYSVV